MRTTGTAALSAVLAVLVAGCTGGPRDAAPPAAPSAASSSSSSPQTRVFECGTLGPAAVPARRLRIADICLRDALAEGRPARVVRVSVSAGRTTRTSYVVTGRAALTVSSTSGTSTRVRVCTNATGLLLSGTCSRDPLAGR